MWACYHKGFPHDSAVKSEALVLTVNGLTCICYSSIEFKLQPLRYVSGQSGKGVCSQLLVQLKPENIEEDNANRRPSHSQELEQAKTINNTYFLTPWSKVLLQKLTGFQLVKEFPALYGNPKVHYRIRKCPPPVPLLSQRDPVHNPTSYFLKIHLNIILPSRPESPKWSLSLRFPYQNPVYASPLPNTLYIPRSSHSSRFYQPKNTGWAVQIIQLLINTCFTILFSSSLCTDPVYMKFVVLYREIIFSFKNIYIPYPKFIIL